MPTSDDTHPPTVYLDHAATGWPRQPAAERAMRDALDAALGNPGRSAHAMARRSAAIRERARAALATLAGLDDPRRAVLTSGCTMACHIAIAGVLDAARRRPGHAATHAPPRVIASALEHNAIARPLAEASRRGDIELTILEPTPSGLIDPASVAAAISHRPAALVCITHASNVIGTIQPVAEIARAIHALDRPDPPLLLCDAAQTAGLLNEPLSHTGADLIALGAHKSLGGPMGIGALLIGPRAWPDPATANHARLAPTIHGGTGGEPIDHHGLPTVATPMRLPEAFEPGTPDLLACAGLAAAAEQYATERAAGTPADHRLRRAQDLIARARVGLRRLHHRGVRVLADPPGTDWNDTPRVGVLSFAIAPDADHPWDPHELAAALDASFGIAVRAGLHCAPWCHRWLGTRGAVRISVGRQTAEHDMDALLHALDSLL